MAPRCYLEMLQWIHGLEKLSLTDGFPCLNKDLHTYIIPIPRTWRVYLATGFDFRGKNRACFGSIGVLTLASVSYLVTIL